MSTRDLTATEQYKGDEYVVEVAQMSDSRGRFYSAWIGWVFCHATQVALVPPPKDGRPTHYPHFMIRATNADDALIEARRRLQQGELEPDNNNLPPMRP